jgi:hypothetical protein
MSSTGLVDLARRFVALSDELEEVRGEIRMAVLNGGGAPHPQSPAVMSGGEQPKTQSDRIAKSQATDEAVMTLLRSNPGMKSSAIARALAANKATTSQRLERLAAKGQISRDESGVWAVAG